VQFGRHNFHRATGCAEKEIRDGDAEPLGAVVKLRVGTSARFVNQIEGQHHAGPDIAGHERAGVRDDRAIPDRLNDNQRLMPKLGMPTVQPIDRPLAEMYAEYVCHGLPPEERFPRFVLHDRVTALRSIAVPFDCRLRVG
jgi:hypothetical protein